MQQHFRTYYENLYKSEDYYWGKEPAGFCDELMKYCSLKDGKTVLDIGCGEGKDAVYFAKKGYTVSAFDLASSGVEKTKRLAGENNVDIHVWVDDVNTFKASEQYDIIYSTGTIQYLFDENKAPFFEKINKMTKPNGIVFFNVFVDKPFLELPPDWDVEEKMWKTGELFTYFSDWEILRIDEDIFLDFSGGASHFHCMDTIICMKRVSGTV